MDSLKFIQKSQTLEWCNKEFSPFAKTHPCFITDVNLRVQIEYLWMLKFAVLFHFVSSDMNKD